MPPAFHGVHPGISSKDTIESSVHARNAELLARTSASSPASIAFISATRQTTALIKATVPRTAITAIVASFILWRRTSPAREVSIEHLPWAAGKPVLLFHTASYRALAGYRFFHAACTEALMEKAPALREQTETD